MKMFHPVVREAVQGNDETDDRTRCRVTELIRGKHKKLLGELRSSHDQICGLKSSLWLPGTGEGLKAGDPGKCLKW